VSRLVSALNNIGIRLFFVFAKMACSETSDTDRYPKSQEIFYATAAASNCLIDSVKHAILDIYKMTMIEKKFPDHIPELGFRNASSTKLSSF